MKRYKATKRSLRPWHFSLSDRLRGQATRKAPEGRYKGPKALKIYWHHSFRRWRLDW